MYDCPGIDGRVVHDFKSQFQWNILYKKFLNMKGLYHCKSNALKKSVSAHTWMTQLFIKSKKKSH